MGLFGNGQSPGLLGTGQFDVQPISVDQTAFQNPLGNVAPQLGSELTNYANSAYTPVNAANSSYVGSGAQGALNAANQYAQLASGQGPSLATVTAQQQGAAGLAGAESMLGSARGAGSPAAALLAARQAQTQNANQVAQNAVQGRTAEELGALSGAAGAYGQVASTGLQQQAQQNAIAQGNQQLQNTSQNQLLQALMGENAQQQQGQIAGATLTTNTALSQQQLQAQAYQAAAAANAKAVGSVLQGAAGIGAML